jgi:hypothetical protein
MFKEKERKKLPPLGFEPTPHSFNAVDSDSSLFEYFQKEDNALCVYYLKMRLVKTFIDKNLLSA